MIKINVKNIKQGTEGYLVSFHGELKESNSEKIMEEILLLINNNIECNLLKFDFRELIKINSRSIGYLGIINDILEERGGELILINTREVYDLLLMVGADTMVNVSNDKILELLEYGSFVKIKNNKIIIYPMLENGEISIEDGSIMEEPADDNFLQIINSYFKTKFNMNNFN